MLTVIKNRISSKRAELDALSAEGGSLRSDQHGVTIVELMIVIAVAALIIVLVLVAAPALQRNARNTQRRNDIGAIRGQLTTVFTNNNNTYPVSGVFGTDILGQVEQAIYKNDTPVAGWTTAKAIPGEEVVRYAVTRPGTTPVTTETGLDGETAKQSLPGPDELHVFVGVQCGDAQLAGGNPTLPASATAATAYVAADLNIATLKTVAFVYQLEGETTARCEDNA